MGCAAACLTERAREDHAAQNPRLFQTKKPFGQRNHPNDFQNPNSHSRSKSQINSSLLISL